MNKRFFVTLLMFCLFPILCCNLTGCTLAAEKDGQRSGINFVNEAASQETAGGLEKYRAAIDANKNSFEVTIGEEYFSEMAGEMMRRTYIKNISPQAYYWIALDIVFADKDGNVCDTVRAGVYDSILPQEIMGYNVPAGGDISQGYVVSYIDNYQFE